MVAFNLHPLTRTQKMAALLALVSLGTDSLDLRNDRCSSTSLPHHFVCPSSMFRWPYTGSPAENRRLTDLGTSFYGSTSQFGPGLV